MISRFLWWVAGANDQILQKPQFATDRLKYSAIGASLLFTSSMSVVSGGYAFYTVFSSILVASMGGLFWGVGVLILDRLLLVITHKEDEISLQQIFSVLIRIGFASIIGVIVSVPLEIKIFEDRINAQIALNNANTAITVNETVAKAFPQIQELKEDKQTLLTTLKEKSNQVEKAYQSKIEEAEGIAGSLKRGKGIVYEDKERKYNKLEKEYQQLQQQTQGAIARIDHQLASWEQQMTARIEQINKDQSAQDLVTKLETLAQLSKESVVIHYAHWLIRILFISIDVSPILAKLLAKRTPYDVVIECSNQQSIWEAEEELQNFRHFVAQKQHHEHNLVGEIFKATFQQQPEIIKEMMSDVLDLIKDSVRKTIAKFNFRDRQVEKSVKKIAEESLADLAKTEMNSRLYRNRVNHNADEVTKTLKEYVNGQRNGKKPN